MIEGVPHVGLNSTEVAPTLDGVAVQEVREGRHVGLDTARDPWWLV